MANKRLKREFWRHHLPDALTNTPVPASYCASPFRPPIAVQAKEWVKKLSRHVVSVK